MAPRLHRATATTDREGGPVGRGTRFRCRCIYGLVSPLRVGLNLIRNRLETVFETTSRGFTFPSFQQQPKYQRKNMPR